MHHRYCFSSCSALCTALTDIYQERIVCVFHDSACYKSILIYISEMVEISFNSRVENELVKPDLTLLEKKVHDHHHGV
jgi:hypothetical protein